MEWPRPWLAEEAYLTVKHSSPSTELKQLPTAYHGIIAEKIQNPRGDSYHSIAIQMIMSDKYYRRMPLKDLFPAARTSALETCSGRFCVCRRQRSSAAYSADIMQGVPPASTPTQDYGRKSRTVFITQNRPRFQTRPRFIANPVSVRGTSAPPDHRAPQRDCVPQADSAATPWARGD